MALDVSRVRTGVLRGSTPKQRQSNRADLCFVICCVPNAALGGERIFMCPKIIYLRWTRELRSAEPFADAGSCPSQPQQGTAGARS